VESKEFSKIRHELEMTQNHLSRILCVSTKAIQSFEQGWRNISPHIQREMLLLLSLKQISNMMLGDKELS
jgi:DNA-binding transcriptional regulator YiaG